MFAEVRMIADADEERGRARAPISLAVVLDTSGSMSGEKIEEAKRSVLRLLSEMRDDDQIALVRYSDSAEIVQRLASVKEVRGSLSSRIRELTANGGTNIPSGLSEGLEALGRPDRERVRRVILVSDGLDSTRAQAEELARNAFRNGVTVSSLGIGVDFDESYMGAVSQNGHGNFAFVKDGASLASFLTRELVETASTTIENAKVKLTLPSGVKFVSATGADANVSGRDVELSLGSLFAGDDRRVIVELASDGSDSGRMEIETNARWDRVGGKEVSVDAPRIGLLATADPSEVERGRDGTVMASATSVMASRRQVEAAKAYADGDLSRANLLVEQNEAALGDAMRAAPAPAASALQAQLDSYRDTKKGFSTIRPTTAPGKAAAKAAAAKEMGNFSRKAW
ncbi:hypothetical protein AKJ09_01913 [Labilithrix luteola]|uniref:VWFA domain-containing protein n=1 Tax=Labilithrix luteola TaxID=1391654 RepID=A0A0K1PQ72_9BACT|nr:VWA domain-containing protein [Labilithrix luteola]AKU95249.1 hypothetical protein AKJ09_01913 [Labilithrix luteola]